MTIIKVATPKQIPRKEKADIIFKIPSFFLALNNLLKLIFQIYLTILYSFSNILINSLILTTLVSLPSSLNSNS